MLCTHPDSDSFHPRQNHGACSDPDGNLWVFGGMYNVGEREVYLNDVMKLTKIQEKGKLERIWKKAPAKGNAPAPRYGHVQVCFYNYIFIFGGQGNTGHVFGDLWVFDIVKNDWHLLADSENKHEMTH